MTMRKTNPVTLDFIGNLLFDILSLVKNLKVNGIPSQSK